MSNVSPEQRLEWVENPVTLKALELAQEELKDILDTPIIDCLFHGDPNKTQENIVNLEARASAWETLIYVLTGDWSYFVEPEEPEDEE